MAVIAASRVLRDVTLGPSQVWVLFWVLVQLVWPGSEGKCNVCLVVGSSEIASEAVSLYGGRPSHWPGCVVVWEDGNFGDPDGSDDDECPVDRNCLACPGVACQADKILAATIDDGLDYLCLGLRICISRPF